MSDADHTQAPRSKAERSAATRETLIAAATELFAEHGYVATAREEICRRAGVTRGALDHHFDGKRGLFAAAVLDVEMRLNERIAAAALREEDPVAALRAGCREYLEAATDPDVRRILLLDARAVLDWDQWLEMHSAHGLRLTIMGVEAAMQARGIRRRSSESAARLLLAALTEAALYVATADDPADARSEAMADVDRILEGLLAWP